MKRHILSCTLLMHLFFGCSAADDLQSFQKIKLILQAVESKDREKIIALVDSEDLADLALTLITGIAESSIPIEIIQPLLEKGACPNARYREHHYQGETLLGGAVRSRTPQAQKIPTLIALGADPNFPNKNGQTPLHICVEFVSDSSRVFEEILTLLHHGANPLLKNNENKTPRESISDYCWSEYSKESQKIADLLEQAEQRYLHRKRIQMIRNQGIPPRNFKMKGKKIPEHLLAAASSSSESHSALLSKSWPEKTVLQ